MKRFITALAGLTALTSVGPGLTDERHQLQGAYQAAAGRLKFTDAAPQFYETGRGVGFTYDPQHLAVDGGYTVVASNLISFAAFPTFHILRLVDAIVPVTWLLIALWGLGLYWVVRWGVQALRPMQWWARPAPLGLTPTGALLDGVRRMTVPHRVLAAAVAALTIWQLSVASRLDFDLWGIAVALQLNAIVATAIAVVLFHRLLMRIVPGWPAHVGAALLLTATPLAFWGTQMKYHGPMMVLVVAAMYLYTVGRQDNRVGLRVGGIVLAALSLFNHLSGAFLLAGVALAEVVHAGGWRRERLRSHVAAGAALLAGLLPFLVYNKVVFGNPLTDAVLYQPGFSEESTGGGVEGALAATVDRVEFQTTYVDSPGMWENALSAFGLAHNFEGGPVAVFAITPILVLALLAPFAIRRFGWSAAHTIGAGLIVANLVGYLQRVHTQGAGYDVRFLAISIPALLFFAVIGLAWVVKDAPRVLRSAAVAYGAGAMMLFALMLVLADAKFLLDYKDEMRQPFVVMHTLGPAVFTGILLAAVGRRWLGAHQQPVLGAYLGLGVLLSHLWVFTVLVILHTGIPAHAGYDAYTHVLPATEGLSDLARRLLIPQKWSIAPENMP